MRSLTYFRTPLGSKSFSPNTQEAILGSIERYCSAQGFIQRGTFVDKPKGDIVEFKRMVGYIKESAQGYFVVIPSIAHLGDLPRQQAARLIELESVNCQVRCIDSLNTYPLRIIMDANKEQMVTSAHRKSVHAGMKAKASLGIGLGRPPYGYRIGKNRLLEIVGAEASIVLAIFDMYLSESIGVRAIAKRLKENGDLTRNRKFWTMSGVRAVLRNGAYMGTYRRFGFRISGTHPNIVPPSTFREVQDRMRARTPMHRRRSIIPFLLTGILYCGVCNKGMMGVSRSRTWQRKNGDLVKSQYRYYHCQRQVNSFEGDCKSQRAINIENLVLELVKSSDFWCDILEALDLDKNGGEAIQQIESDIKKTEKQYLNWIQKASDGIISIRQLAVKFSDLDGKRTELEDRKILYAGGGQGRIKWLGNQIRKIGIEWDKLNFESQQELLQRTVRRITVFQDNVKVLPRV
jgi:DNA invertase Pin-like site-specific DNA recombinase